MGKNPDPGSEMNIPDHIFEGLGNKIFGFKILLCEYGSFGMKNFGSGG